VLKIVAALSLILLYVPISSLAQSDVYIDVLTAWVKDKNSVMKVVIVDRADATDQKIAIINKVLLSRESFSDSNGKFFVGWQEALEQLRSKSLPTKFIISYSDKPINDGITIELLSVENSQYIGYMTPRYDNDKKIISAKIKMYDVPDLTDAQFENILRHEMGHALGLGHTKINESLMYPVVDSNPKYISSCELNALKAISDGVSFQSVDCYGA